jgi:hypothetical protein
MLDYKQLDKEITDLLNNTSREVLLSWLDDKIERENRERIVNGEIAIFTTGNCMFNNSDSANILTYITVKSAGENNYALAA